MNEKKVLAQMAPYKQGKQIEEVKQAYGLTHIVKLASNENPFGHSKKLQEKLPDLLHQFEIYPDGHTAELRKQLAEHLGVQEDMLVFGCGSDELVLIISRTFLYPGVNTVMAKPTFPQYRHNALVEGAEIKEVPTVNGYHDLESMLDAIDSNTNVVWLCSPNNPTGCVIPKNDFYTFMDQCPDDVLVVLDEAYYEYMDPSLDLDVIGNLNNYPNLLTLRTFSKAYGLAGLRVGYGIGNPDIIAKLNVVRAPFNNTSFSQKAAQIALKDQQFIKDAYSKNKKIKEDFEQFLTKLGWSYCDSETNFLLITVPVSGDEMYGYLLKHGFIVRPGEGLGCPNTIRLTIGNEQDMNELKTILQQFPN